jgi:hypothetical protein
LTGQLERLQTANAAQTEEPSVAAIQAGDESAFIALAER